MYPRRLNLKKLCNENSVLLFGPRATGKSSLIRDSLKPALFIDLLSNREFARYSAEPSLLSDMAQGLPAKSLIVIDEVQKVPALLDEVHRLMEKHELLFLLTGSSARKLKRGQANLLAGRAWTREMFPLTSEELGEDFNLLKYLQRGGLPRVYLSKDYHSDLESYVGTYLKEEIQAEALTRNLSMFSRFLETIALQSGEELFLEGIASDTGVKAKTVSNYIEVLEDTLLGFRVPAFQKTVKRKAIARSKFYLFDVGVTGALTQRSIKSEKSPEYGKAFEQFIAQELRAYISYEKKRLPLQYWRSVTQQEVDFVIGSEIAIEVKSTERVSPADLRGLLALKEEKIVKKFIIVSNDEKCRTIEGVDALPVGEFLKRLWSGELF